MFLTMAAGSASAAKKPNILVIWGDSHLHTALSPDAGLFGNTLGIYAKYLAELMHLSLSVDVNRMTMTH